MANFWCFIVVVFNFTSVFSYSFDTENVLVISRDSVRDTYFGYSLLLQAGEKTSSLIVGAPRNLQNDTLGGDLYNCDISFSDGTTCVQYPAGESISSNTVNGNFFGMTIDGDSNVDGSVVACAPRTVSNPTRRMQQQPPFLKGHCVYFKNTSRIAQPAIQIIPLAAAGNDISCCDQNKRSYYDLGYAMAGFDLSFYSEDELLLGAPGVKKFNGATILYSLDNPGVVNFLPNRKEPVTKYDDTYFGYSVTTAKFKPNSNQVWFLTGAPRANNLKGTVSLYYYDVAAREKTHIVTTFEGEEMGAYFGSVILAADVSNDGIMDVLVAAPMSSGKTWDEGHVYFYKGLNEKSFLRKVKLVGSSKMGGRFGAAMQPLGDFDLDGFNDIAIAAPYEDDGRGAVYIYRGSQEGLTEQFSQRITPSAFGDAGSSTKGFGLGMSKGNDIDGNGHNDMAIGSYKSSQAFIMKSQSIIDYQSTLASQINQIQNDTDSFQVEFCLLYTKRSDKPILERVNFSLSFDVDYRSTDGNFKDQIAASLSTNYCKNYSFSLRETMMDISPLHITLAIELSDNKNLIAHGKNLLELQIPYSHGCGDDNVCNTDLTIEINSHKNNLVLGLNDQINLNVTVTNFGEPAYQCEVKLLAPDGLVLRNAQDCIKNELDYYTCLFKERLIGSYEKEFVFDVNAISPDTTRIRIEASVDSLGVNKAGSRNKTELELPVILESTSYITGKSLPEHVELELKSTNMENIEVTHQFSVDKKGPSPLRINVDIFLPLVEHNGENIFNIIAVKGVIDSLQISCNVENEIVVPYNSNALNLFQNRTILVSCDDGDSGCVKYSCQGDYLYDSGQLAQFKVQVLIKSNLLVAKFQRQLPAKDVVAYVPYAYQTTLNDRVNASAKFLIFTHSMRFIPLWVYLLAPSLGVILLILISYGLYKCHFFDRIYKEKLEQEKTHILHDDEVEEEIFDDVLFRPMQPN